MRVTAKLLLLTVLFACLGQAAPVDEKITVDYTFSQPEIRQVTHAGETYDQVIMTDAPSSGNTGQPCLPSIGARVLIPYGREVVSVNVITGDPVYLGDNYYVEPVAEPVELYRIDQAKPPVPDAVIYNSDRIFPMETFESISGQGFRGYQILIVKLNPVTYRPLSGELNYYPDMQVSVVTTASDKDAELFRGLAIDEQELLSKIDNPEIINSYAAAPIRTAKAYDLLIISTPALAASFQPLKDYHDANGILTEIHTTTDVGSNDPDDIRDYIRDRYLGDGITYAIIGGDDDIIPAKDLYVLSYSGGPTESNMPSDIFLGCLDGTYNNDGDGNWGEPNDGPGGGDVDLIAEVYIGRASVGNTTEADRFVTKTLWYLNRQHTQPEKVLMVGEYLGFGYPADYAGDMMDEIVDGTSAHGYTTVGIPSDVYDVDRLYERDWADWPQSAIISRINDGVHIINHLGHGSENQAMKIYNSDITGDLNNTDLCFVYSQTCLAGHFDGTDCWAETMNIKTDHGGWGVVMNARYGWGSYNTTDGPSQRFDREFWDAVFGVHEGMPEVGRANQDSKEDNLYRINQSCMRWITYELTLFGDPTVAIQGVTGIRFSYPGDIPEFVVPGQQTTFDVVVSGTGDGVPVPGTGQLHYSIGGAPYDSVSMTENFPNEYEAVLPSISCDDVLNFYLSADEQTHGTMYDHSSAAPYSAIPATSVDTIFADDFDYDLGWTTSGGTWGRGIPTGGGGAYGNPDPTSGHSGTSVYGYNLNGDYTNSMPEYHLTSPAIDCGGLGGVSLSFWRWLGVEQPLYDHAYVRISTNGSSWTTIWDNNSTITDNAWSEKVFDISQYADGEATVYIRFTMGTTDGGWTYCGWNIDDVMIIGMACDEDRPIIATASVPDWTVGHGYSEQLSASGGHGSYTWSDRDGNLVGTGLSLTTAGLLSGTPTSAGQISFMAFVEDDSLEYDEHLFSFTISDVVAITTADVPDWTAGHPYAQQLYATGGTGGLTWTDQNNDLSGTGLTLSSAGLVSGTPVAGPISFTAVATDNVGAYGQHAYAATINPALNITTTELPNGILNIAYSASLASTGGTGTIVWSDLNGDLTTTGLTLAANGLLSGTPTDTGTITFTARTLDQVGANDQQEYSFAIVEQIHIATTIVADWTLNHPRSTALEVTGVQGTATWTELGSGLDGTGLQLTSDGVLSGSPTALGDITFTANVADDGPIDDQHEYTFTINPEVAITTESLLTWTVGVPYEQQLTVTGGTWSIVWSDASSNLEGTGLSISAAGLLQGTATVSGDLSFTAHAEDKVGAFDEKELTVTMNPAPTVTTESLPNGKVNMEYDQLLVASGGTGDLTFSDRYSSLEGTGLTLNGTGQLAGTPVEAGTINFTVLVTDEVGGTGLRAFALNIDPSLLLTTEDLPDWTVDAAYLQQLEASYGVGTLTWADKYDDLSGTGLSLTADGQLSGTPIIVGTIAFTAEVSDEASGYDEKELSFTINPALQITTTELPEWTIACSYSQTVICTGGTGTISFSDEYGDLAGTGLALSASGVITGTPTTSGVINFTASVTDEGGGNTTQALSISINPAIEITTVSLPDAVDGDYYTTTLGAQHGTAPNVWSDKYDELATYGLSLATDGTVTGTPVGVQTLLFTAMVTDDCGSVDEQAFSLYVGPAYLCGDIDNNGDGPDVADLIYLTSFMFQDGPEPPVMAACDVDGNGGEPDIADLIYLVAFMFQEGPDLICEGTVVSSNDDNNDETKLKR